MFGVEGSLGISGHVPYTNIFVSCSITITGTQYFASLVGARVNVMWKLPSPGPRRILKEGPKANKSMSQEAGEEIDEHRESCLSLPRPRPRPSFRVQFKTTRKQLVDRGCFVVRLGVGAGRWP